MTDSFASLFNCSPVGRPPDSVIGPTLFKLVWARLSIICCLVLRGSIGGFLLLRYFSGVVSHPGLFQVSKYVSVESPSLSHHRPYSLFVCSLC